MLNFFTQTFLRIKYFSFCVLLFGIAIYTIGSFENGKLSYIMVYDFPKTVGVIIIFSAVFISIVKVYRATYIFKKERIKVVCAKDHLEKTNDLETIINKINLQFFKQKFKKISTRLQKIIKDYYLSRNNHFYYKDYKIETIIEYDKENEGYIKVTEETGYKLITNDVNCAKLKFNSIISFPSDDNEKTTYQLDHLTINDVDVTSSLDKELKVERTATNLNISFNSKIDCESTKKDFIISRKDTKIYNLNSNPYISHSTFWLYENLEFNLIYPEEIEFEWLNVGASGKWKVEPSINDFGRKLKAKYTSLLFENQGFLLRHK